MPSPQGIFAALAAATGTGLRPVQYAARLLREDGAGGWPEIGTGRRGNVSISHALNLVVAMEAAGGRPSEGPRLVREFRALRSQGFEAWRVNASTGAFSPTRVPLESPSLGDLMDGWLHSLTHPEDRQGHPLLNAKRQQPSVRLILTTPMTAEVTLPELDGSGGFDRLFYQAEGTLPGLDTLSAQPSRLARQEVHFGMPELRALAEVLRNAYSPEPELFAGTTPSPGRDGDEATPEATKAAGAGTHDGLQSRPPATGQGPDLDSSDLTARTSRNQSRESHAASLRVGHHRSVNWKEPPYGTAPGLHSAFA